LEAGREPPWLFQYGTLLTLDDASLFSDGVDSFSRYRTRAVQTLPYRAVPSLEGLRLDGPAVDVTLVLERPQVDTAAAVELGCQRLGQAPRAWAVDAFGAVEKAQVSTVPGAVFLFPPQGSAVRALHLSFDSEACRVRTARWFVWPAGT
jgi:hypothetical protein